MFAEELLGEKTWIMRDKLLYVSTPYIPLRDQLKNAGTACIETQILQKKTGKQIKAMRLRT